MKIIPCLLALAACVFYSGCTAIAVRGPVGEPAPDDVVNELVGTWIGERVDGVDSKLVIERIPDSRFLVGRYDEDDERKETRFLPTRIKDGIVVLWAETAAEGFLAPGRAMLSEHSLVVLIPDQEEVESMLAKGILAAAPEEEEGLLMIEPRGVEEAMATKAFWSIDHPMALIKEQVSQQGDGEPKPGEADASPTQEPSRKEGGQ